ncbi:hypothetical protein CKO44_11695 [Rubrivivax gelatinosus]|uniref:iron-sulfur cluster assembly protein n=1 Tax=Rubrivivax gelatinosus TaxID=28068 RepID=UPI0019061C44|nr:iron-sulfur cluster assembly protein [Rubrivivax gelatinosus]MBK1614131.1 hypothetical protein [Rubrivivax gelatinosus]
MNKTQPIRLLPEPGCGGCQPSHSGCGGGFGRPCTSPELRGQPELVRCVLDSLRGVVDVDGGNIVDRQLVKALRIDDGEAELTVSFAPSCGIGRDLAEGAFQTLRRVLPNTDVYVRHAV